MSRLVSHLASHIPVGLLLLSVPVWASACGAEDPEGSATNVLPTQGDSEDSSGTTAPTSMSMSTTTDPSDTADTDTGGELPLPVAYRFECIDIQQVGDADGTVFQATLLED